MKLFYHLNGEPIGLGKKRPNNIVLGRKRGTVTYTPQDSLGFQIKSNIEKK